MEEVRNIEKTKENVGKMEREESPPDREEDMVKKACCGLKFGSTLTDIFYHCHLFLPHSRTMGLKVKEERGLLRYQKCV